MLDEEGALAGAIREPEPEDDEDEGGPDWLPEPVDAIRSRKERNADAIARLTDGCFFVPEFHTLLLEKLLRKLDYDTHEETMQLELLKIRFGDVTCLSQCEVMLADMATSRRIHNYTRDRHLTASQLMDEEPDEDVFSVMVASHLYWPKIATHDFRNPVPAIRDARNVYSSRFPEQKPNRRLEWRTGAGTVEIELTPRDGQVTTLVVSELEAAVMWLFGDEAVAADDWNEADPDQPQWMGLDELMGQLKAETSGPGFEAELRAALAFWVGKGYLLENSGKWRVVEDPEAEGEGKGYCFYRAMRAFHRFARLSAESVVELLQAASRPAHGADMAAVNTQKREEERQRQETEAELFAKFGPMIISMITNQGAHSAARIESVLTMFFQYAGGPDPLKRLLDKLVEEGTLSAATGGTCFEQQPNDIIRNADPLCPVAGPSQLAAGGHCVASATLFQMTSFLDNMPVHNPVSYRNCAEWVFGSIEPFVKKQDIRLINQSLVDLVQAGIAQQASHVCVPRLYGFADALVHAGMNVGPAQEQELCNQEVISHDRESQRGILRCVYCTLKCRAPFKLNGRGTRIYAVRFRE
ncbi:Anaphase-promoting complex subunit 2 [Geranomyces michiganensis]|nr:Anaphase-promoting complex subunit 2 [Geranomyces michiganensis]